MKISRLADVRWKHKNFHLEVQCIEHLSDPPQRPTEPFNFHYRIADSSGSANLILPKSYMVRCSQSLKEVISFPKIKKDSTNSKSQLLPLETGIPKPTDDVGFQHVSHNQVLKTLESPSEFDSTEDLDSLKKYIMPYDIIRVVNARAGRNKGCMAIMLMDKSNLPHNFVGYIEKIGTYCTLISLRPNMSVKQDELEGELELCPKEQNKNESHYQHQLQLFKRETHSQSEDNNLGLDSDCWSKDLKRLLESEALDSLTFNSRSLVENSEKELEDPLTKQDQQVLPSFKSDCEKLNFHRDSQAPKLENESQINLKFEFQSSPGMDKAIGTSYPKTENIQDKFLEDNIGRSFGQSSLGVLNGSYNHNLDIDFVNNLDGLDSGNALQETKLIKERISDEIEKIQRIFYNKLSCINGEVTRDRDNWRKAIEAYNQENTRMANFCGNKFQNLERSVDNLQILLKTLNAKEIDEIQRVFVTIKNEKSQFCRDNSKNLEGFYNDLVILLNNDLAQKISDQSKRHIISGLKDTNEKIFHQIKTLESGWKDSLTKVFQEIKSQNFRMLDDQKISSKNSLQSHRKSAIETENIKSLLYQLREQMEELGKGIFSKNSFFIKKGNSRFSRLKDTIKILNKRYTNKISNLENISAKLNNTSANHSKNLRAKLKKQAMILKSQKKELLSKQLELKSREDRFIREKKKHLQQIGALVDKISNKMYTLRKEESRIAKLKQELKQKFKKLLQISSSIKNKEKELILQNQKLKTRNRDAKEIIEFSNKLHSHLLKSSYKLDDEISN